MGSEYQLAARWRSLLVTALPIAAIGRRARAEETRLKEGNVDWMFLDKRRAPGAGEPEAVAYGT